jgi:hypothetical protein
MNTFDQRLITLIRQLISWLVAGDYEAAQRRSRGIRLSADLMRDAVLRYGRTLVIPPDTAFAGIDAIEVRNAASPTWSVRFDLWTAEEGRSDLSLECTLIDRGAGDIDLEIDNLHSL